MKKKVIITAASIAAVIVLAVAVIFTVHFLSKEKLNVEVNTEFDLSTLKGYTDYADLAISYQGEDVAVEKEKIVFDKLGVYKVKGKGLRYEITVEDTTAPVVQLMGSLMKLQATDEVELPEIRVIDNYDENIKDYTLNVYSGDTEVLVENQAFYVADSGDYVIRMSAKDSSGNQGKKEKTIHVTPLFDKKVKAGEEVEIRSSWISYLLPEGSSLEDYEFSYQIYRNGELMDSADNKFIAEGNCYYNVCITATSKTKEESYSGWIIFVEEHARMLTFTTMTTDEIGNAGYNLICNPYELIERSVKDYGDGRFVMNMDVDVTHFKENENLIVLAWPVDAWGLPKNITDYDASFTITLKGKLKANAKSAEFEAGGYENKVYQIPVEGNDGYFETTAQISTEKIAAFTEGGVTRVYYTLTVPKEKLAELEIDVDNFQLTPKAPPMYTGETYLSKELGDRVLLTEESLGLAATDCLGGTVKSIEVTGVKVFDETVSGKRRDFKKEVLEEKGIYFVQCHITDYYGNEADAEMIVSIGMGVLDVKAPEIRTEQTDHVVSAGTVITLGEQGIDGYLTIEEESSYKVSYRVYRNGKEIKAGSSFTVGEYDRYEVYVTAIDSSLLANEGKGYVMFVGSGLKDAIATMSTEDYAAVNYGGESQLTQNGIQKGFFYPFTAQIEEESGNKYVKLTQCKPEYGRMEILFPAKQNERGIVADFDFKVGGNLSGQLSDSAVLFEIGGEKVTVADAKAGKRFTVSIPNLYNRLPEEIGLRTQAVYFENCENFLKEKGLYLCVDNIQAEKVFDDLYSESTSFETVALNKTAIVVNNKDEVLKLTNSGKYELEYEVYRNGNERVNTHNITRSGYEYYEVYVNVFYKGTNQLRTQLKMTFQWDTDSFITMENGEKFYHVKAANGNPDYDQLLDSRDTVQMEMFPFLGALKKDAQNNTYLELTLNASNLGASVALINIGDASEHKADVGFTFWIEGDVSGLSDDTLLTMLGGTEILAKDIGRKFTYQNKLNFNGCFSDPIRLQNYNVLYQKGLKLCMDNVWRKKIADDKLFESKYDTVNVCSQFTVDSQSITSDKGTVLRLTDSGKYELVCEIYKNGTDKITAATVNREGNDFYSVNVSVRNKSTQKLENRFELIFAGETDDFRTMEEGEKFWRIPALGDRPTFDQFLDAKEYVRLEFYPFTGEMKVEDGNTYVALTVSGPVEGAVINIIDIEDNTNHRSDVGFDFWIEGDALGAAEEDIVAVIGGQTVRVKDIGRRFYYQNQLAFTNCYGESIRIENAELLKEKGLKLCIDNAWRKKVTDEGGAINDVLSLTLSDGAGPAGFFVATSKPDDFYTCDSWADRPDPVTGGVYVDGKLNTSCQIIKFTDGRYYISVSDGGVMGTEGTIVVIDGTYGRQNNVFGKDPKYGDNYTVTFEMAIFKFTGGAWKQLYEIPEEPTNTIVDVTLFESHGIEIHTNTSPEDDFASSWEYDQRPVRVDGGIYVDGILNEKCVLIKLPDRYIISMYDAGYHSTEDLTEGMVLVLDGIYGRCIGDPKYGDEYTVTFNQAIFQYTGGAWRQLSELPEEPESDIVDSSLIDGNVNGFFVTTAPGDDFFGDDTWGQRPVRMNGGVYVDGTLKEGCTLIKLSDRYYIALSDGGVTAQEGTVVVLDGTYGRCGSDPKYGDDYTVAFRQAIFQYTGGAWKQLSEIPEGADITVDSSLIDGNVNGFFVTTAPEDDFFGEDTWGQRPVRMNGGVYVDGTLKEGCTLIKLSDRYYIALSDGGVTAKEGTVVVLDGTYGRCGSDPKYGDDYTVAFRQAIFQYTGGAWKQLSEIPEGADITVDSSLIDGTVNGFFITTAPGDDFFGDDTWGQRPVRMNGGVYVDGTLKEGCILIKLSDRYYIALSDGGVTAQEGTIVVLDGTYGRCGSDPKYGDDYTVKFNKVAFKYTSGSWQQIPAAEKVTANTAKDGINILSMNFMRKVAKQTGRLLKFVLQAIAI